MWPLLGPSPAAVHPATSVPITPEALFTEHGWEAEVIQPGEREANYGRWLYPVAPRWMLVSLGSSSLGHGVRELPDPASLPARGDGRAPRPCAVPAW